MDKERQIRLMYPPMIVFAFMVGAFPTKFWRWIEGHLKQEGFQEIIGLVASGAVLVVVSGFVLANLSNLLFCLCYSRSGQHWEADLDQKTIRRIAVRLGIRTKDIPTHPKQKQRFQLAVAALFDHELFTERVHTWHMRRWHSFRIASTAAISLLILELCSVLFPPEHPKLWFPLIAGTIGLLSLGSALAWRETMAMFETQSLRRNVGGGGQTFHSQDSDPED